MLHEMAKNKRPPKPVKYTATGKAGEPQTLNLPEDVAKTITSVQFEAPPGITLIYSRVLGAPTIEVFGCPTDEVNACRVMMQGTPEEQAFARRNHDARLVHFVEWELATPDEEPPEGYELLGAVEGS